MPPKGKGKAKAKATGNVGQGAPVASQGGEQVSAFALKGNEIGLRPGEKGCASFRYLKDLASAWELIQDNPVFNKGTPAMPLKVLQDAVESGTQAPLSQMECEMVLKASLQTYTAGVNLFWIALHWPATPGVPLRVKATEHLAS